MFRFTKKDNKGITMIALVITIIVLLILASITLASLSGENGIIKKAHEAKNATESRQEQENNEINNILGYLDPTDPDKTDPDDGHTHSLTTSSYTQYNATQHYNNQSCSDSECQYTTSVLEDHELTDGVCEKCGYNSNDGNGEPEHVCSYNYGYRDYNESVHEYYGICSCGNEETIEYRDHEWYYEGYGQIEGDAVNHRYGRTCLDCNRIENGNEEHTYVENDEGLGECTECHYKCYHPTPIAIWIKIDETYHCPRYICETCGVVKDETTLKNYHEWDESGENCTICGYGPGAEG